MHTILPTEKHIKMNSHPCIAQISFLFLALLPSFISMVPDYNVHSRGSHCMCV